MKRDRQSYSDKVVLIVARAEEGTVAEELGIDGLLVGGGVSEVEAGVVAILAPVLVDEEEVDGETTVGGVSELGALLSDIVDGLIEPFVSPTLSEEVLLIFL